MDLDLFLSILNIPSLSGDERLLAESLGKRLPFGDCSVQSHEVGDGTVNLLFDWSGTGKPSFVFCTHLDTVPPYIAPVVSDVSEGDILPDRKAAVRDDVIVTGRGSCDAKGQIFAMYSACRQLYEEGFRDFCCCLPERRPGLSERRHIPETVQVGNLSWWGSLPTIVWFRPAKVRRLSESPFRGVRAIPVIPNMGKARWTDS